MTLKIGTKVPCSDGFATPANLCFLETPHLKKCIRGSKVIMIVSRVFAETAPHVTGIHVYCLIRGGYRVSW